MKKLIFFISIFCLFQVLNAQEDSASWKKQTFVTGYLAMNGEYIHNLPVFEQIKKKTGVNIAEASVLATLKPCPKLTIYSVITYKPRLDWNGVIAELSGEFRNNDLIGIKAGRFLLPINPINAQYYAPMNIGIALPTFVTNHSLFPLNINGLDINGKLNLGQTINLNYNLIGGQYSKIARSEEGITGFFGREGVYMSDSLQEVQRMIARIENAETGVYPQYFGAAARLAFDFSSYVKLGFGGFYGDEEGTVQVNPTTSYTTDISFLSYGADLEIEYNNFIFKSSAWFNNETPEDTAHFETYNISIVTGEIGYTLLDKITPYAKLEVINGRSKDWTRVIAGVYFRPVYEIAFKFEYLRYMQDYVDDFNVLQFSLIYSF